MAISPKSPAISLLFLLLVCGALLPIAQLTLAGRPLQTANPNENKETRGTPSKRQAEANVGKKQAETNLERKQTECVDGNGVPQLGGDFMGGGIPAVDIGGGSDPAAVTGGGSVPAVGFDGSVPGAGGQYIPGHDGTFVPIPGFEVPNPAYAAAP